MTTLVDAALIRIGGADNARAPGAPGGSTEERSAEQVARDIASAARAGAKKAVLVGGEPLLRRDLPKLLRAVSARGLTAGLVTNGRMLLYEKLRRMVFERGVDMVRVGLHGATPAVHDHLVRVDGAFDQTVEGLRALLREAPPRFLVDVACTVTTSNLSTLDTWVDLVAGFERRAALALRFVAPLAGLDPEEWAAAGEAAAVVSQALSRASRAGADVVAAWEGFAPCLLETHAHLRDEILRYGAPAVGPPSAGPALPRETGSDRRHAYPCQECVHEATCPGAPVALLARDGEAILRPTTAVRANSFNYEHARDLGELAILPGGCPARALELEGSPARSLILMRGRQAALYHSSTVEFTDAQITRTKDDLEQLYLDVTETATLTEFFDGIRRVRRADACRVCPDRAACCEAWVVDDAPPFRREERWLKKELSRVRGRVLDVGCGEQPYRDEIETLIGAGQIEYHGLDPDPQVLDRIRAAGAPGTLTQVGIEEYVCEPGYFDYVLAFRSINHFRDIQCAFEVISRAMRVQGQLLLCDAPIFGLLRRPQQVRYADAHALHGHEHFRNWSSEQLVEFLRRFPFRVAVHRPVGPQTSNQWLLKMIRLDDPAPGR